MPKTVKFFQKWPWKRNKNIKETKKLLFCFLNCQFSHSPFRFFSFFKNATKLKSFKLGHTVDGTSLNHPKCYRAKAGNSGEIRDHVWQIITVKRLIGWWFSKYWLSTFSFFLTLFGDLTWIGFQLPMSHIKFTFWVILLPMYQLFRRCQLLRGQLTFRIVSITPHRQQRPIEGINIFLNYK